MKRPFVLLTCSFLTWWWYQLVTGDFAASDGHTDVQPGEDVHHNTLRETRTDLLGVKGRASRDVLDTNIGANWDLPDINKNNYEDADWHPPSTLLETRYNLHPDSSPVMHRTNTGVRESNNRSSAEHCGEYSSQMTSNGQCRLTATLPAVPVGTSQKRCPDMFRCTDDISYWLHENQNRKEQLDELRETMSTLQEELRNHGHRVRALETQGDGGLNLNLTFDQRLHSLEFHQTKMDTLLHIHETLLQELETQLRNLSATVQRVNLNTGCRINVIRATSLLSMRDTPPDGRHLSLCPSDCATLYHNGVRRSGVYSIIVSPGSSQPVYCDMETDGGGWTVFQRRRDGSVNFNRGWSEYREGFGEPRGEHWVGNQQLHLLSNQGHYSLRIKLQDWSNAHRHAHYHTFRIEDEENHYRLHVSGFSGTVKDSFAWYHNQQSFSTPDTGNICAEISHAGWWFHQCFYANLNGVYYKGGRYSLKAQNLLGPDGIVWFSWRESDFYSLKGVTMMIRPSNFRPSFSP
ncbi:fibrinogen-like protein 1 [Xyrichtys novacula]|uniref:Fibrinogen-like protein 1 n=1 Tax=Xyrichtys novacula TaxID=13765 RepID=A0AAV1HA40_XYRNO|nr:fibrinogen-like protein 1 [Xyrichtys novacula]